MTQEGQTQDAVAVTGGSGADGTPKNPVANKVGLRVRSLSAARARTVWCRASFLGNRVRRVML